ncbi:general transcription factor 3C polypeptide 5-like protein [Amazona aestiva]|uniref:General transcription factor 3C polypeptide 5-like protein n=1 Tax=Amazona aestiva TaxID=12930 RepID=A0A0Q3MLH2_AMAAE|nr:general transcription factor 3C polypeptide 5-like protein [Amazona aestiva]
MVFRTEAPGMEKSQPCLCEQLVAPEDVNWAGSGRFAAACLLGTEKEGYNNPQVSGENLIGLSRARRPHNAIFVNFDDKEVPAKPLDTAVQTWKKVCTNPVDKKVEEELRKVRYSPNDMPVKAKRSTYNYSLTLTVKKPEDEDDEEEEEEDFKPSDGSENEMETEILDYV